MWKETNKISIAELEQVSALFHHFQNGLVASAPTIITEEHEKFAAKMVAFKKDLNALLVLASQALKKAGFQWGDKIPAEKKSEITIDWSFPRIVINKSLIPINIGVFSDMMQLENIFIFD